MVTTNTPPASPFDGVVLDDESEADQIEIYEEDVEELEGDDIEGIEAEEASFMGEEEDEEDIEGAESLDAIQDDAALVFSKHTGSVFCCHLNPADSNMALTGGEDDMAYVWNTTTGEVIFQCTGHTDSVICGEFSRDGAYVATGDMGGVVQVWRLSSKTVIWETSIGDLSWLKWHHGTSVLFGGSVSGEVYMWKIPSGDCKIFAGHGEKTDCGVLLPDGKRLAVGYDDGSLKVFDLKGGNVLHHLPGRGEGEQLTCLDAHSDNNLIVASTTDGGALLIKSQTGKLVSKLDCNPPRQAASGAVADEAVTLQCVEAVGFCRDNSLLIAATGTLDGHLILWDTSRLVQRSVIKQDSGITRLLWDKNEPILYTAGLDGIVRRYEGRSGTLLKEWSGFLGEILDISMSTDGKTLLVGSDDHTARVFNLSDEA